MDTARLSIRPVAFGQTYALRHRVLWPDKPIDYVKLSEDASGYHAGAFYDDRLVGVISLFVIDGIGRFRKFAVHPDFQQNGIGSQLLKHIIAKARELNAQRLWCDARLDAADFYRKFEMQPEGSLFYKSTIPYTRMSLQLL